MSRTAPASLPRKLLDMRLLKPGVWREPAASHTIPVLDPVLGLSAWPGQMWMSSGSPSLFLPSPRQHQLSRDLESGISRSSRGWSEVPAPFRVTLSLNAGVMPHSLLSHLSRQQSRCQGTGRPVRFLFAHLVFVFVFKTDLKIRFPIKTWVSGFPYPVGSVCPVTGWSWVAAALPGRVARVPAGHGPRHAPLSYTTNRFARVSVAGATGVWDLTTGCGSDLAGLCDSCSQRTPLEPAGVPVSCAAQ